MLVDIFSYLLTLVHVPDDAGDVFVLSNVSRHFVSSRLVCDCNVVLVVLGEELAVLDEVVQSLRASVTNVDTCPRKLWNDAYDDLSSP